MHVHPTQFGAAVQRRKHLAGVEQALVVEGAFEALLLIEVSFREHRTHQVALLDAAAVRPAQNSSRSSSEAETLQLTARHSRAIASTRAMRWSTSACGPSSSTISSASTSSG